MLTRGYMIGQIVDDLSDIASQARQRARLGFTDLHVYIENFAKEVLNRVLGLNLRNLNADRVNAPGLDLADEASGWAFQVTGDKRTEKVKATLEAIGPEDRKRLGKLRILVIGERQGSYTLTGEPFASFSFTEDQIWDFNDVCRQVVGMRIEDLVSLRDYVAMETQRVKIELEVPDKNAKFDTDVSKLIEALPRPRASDGAAMTEYLDGTDYMVDREQVEANLGELSRRLAGLPRLTREVFKMLIERRDEMTTGFNEDFRISVPKLERIYHGPGVEGDLALLKEAGLIDPNQADEHFGSDYWRITIPGSEYGFHHVLLKYAAEKNIDLQKTFVVLDFSGF